MSQPSPPDITSEKIEQDKALVQSQVLEAEAKAKKTSTSKGEKLFDLLTYGGIGFLGVFAAGIPLGYWAKYGGGSGMFKRTAQSLEKSGLSKHAAEDFVMTSVLMQPGNLGLIPIKAMENHKPELVEKFNNMLGDKSSDASIDNDPKQTWISLAKSRAVAWLAVFTGFRGAGMIIGEEKFEKFSNSFAENIVCKPLGKPTHTPGLAKIAANETKLFRYGKIAALDVFATAAATALLYAGTKFFSKPNPQWHPKYLDSKAKEPQATPQQTAAEPSVDEVAPVIASPQANSAAKSFADSIVPRSLSASHKSRGDSFCETVNTPASEPSLILGA